MTQIILYQFPISHYCEKALWALDYKHLPYQTNNLIPGPHMRVIKKMAPLTSVPVIKDQNKIVQDSTSIIDYLDKEYPKHPLSPMDKNLAKEAIDWEEYCDKEIGPHLRRFFYNSILPNRKLATSLMLQRTPAYGAKLYFFIFPFVRYMMRKSMNINPGSAERSEKRLTTAIDRIQSKIKTQKYLVGDTFTRADLTAASLLAPLARPPQHNFNWPNTSLMPQALQEYRMRFEDRPVSKWVRNIYASHRIA